MGWIKLRDLLPLLVLVLWQEAVPAQPAVDPPVPPAGWVTRSWLTADGLPQNSVNAVLQARDGFLWIGTNGGLARFDGVKFRTFGLHEGLHSVVVLSLTQDREGGIWAGTSGGGLSRWKDGHFETYGAGDGLPQSDIITLAPDLDGSLWIGTEQGLVHWKEGVFKPVGEAQGLPAKQIRALLVDSQGVLWASVILDGLYRGQNGKFVKEPVLDGIYSLMESSDGSIRAGAGSGVLWQKTGGAWKKTEPVSGLQGANIESLAEGKDGLIWLGARDGGLLRLVPESPGYSTPSAVESEFSGLSVRSLTVDREGSVWAGTISGGLKRVSSRLIKHWNSEAGLPSGQVTSVTGDVSGSLWAGTPNDGVYRFRDGQFGKLEDPGAPGESPMIYCMAGTADGSVWAAGEQCLYRFSPGGGPTTAFLHQPVRGDAIRALCPDGSTLWAGTYYAALLKCDEAGVQVAAPAGSFPGGITSIVSEAADTLWIGTSGGLHRWERGRIRTWTTQDGLLTAGIRALYRDADGTLWIGTQGGGLARMKAGRFIHVTTRQGLIDDVVSQIIPDDSGDLWLGSNRGIMRLRRDEVEDFANGKTRIVNPVVFGRHEGMGEEQCSGGYSPTACKTPDGRLLFPTVGGIVEIDPRCLPQVLPLVPRPSLDGVVVDGLPQEMDLPLIVPPGKHRIEVGFTAPVLHGGEWVRFRYRLDGLDHNWVMAGNQRVALYDGLPPGRYVFHVAAADVNGHWSRPAAGLVLLLQPVWWQTLWFRAGGMLLLAAASGTAAWWYLQRGHRRQLAALEHERQVQAEVTHLSRVSTLAQLSGSLAHELNQPLGIILSNAQAAQRMLGQPNPDLEELGAILTDIVEEDRRAGELIKRLRALMKRGETRMAPVSPNGIIGDVLRLLRSDLMGRGVTVETLLTPGLPDISGDQVQLQQVLLNLITNGCDAMSGQPAAERIMRITSSLQPNGMVRICLEDQGCGVPEGDCSRIFQPFFTTKDHGMGIGLSICRSIIAAHHGTLRAVPNPGPGTTFYLELKTDLPAAP